MSNGTKQCLQCDVESRKIMKVFLKISSDVIDGDHCVKRVRIRNYSGPHFPVFSLNAKKHGPE